MKNILKNIPTKPGIYLFYKDKELVYVGKATNLKSRVKSYFKGSKTDRPIETHIDQISNIKWLTTDSVLEAIILESIYIKKHQPKYNVLGKDNKSWNYFIITKDKFPELKIIRQYDLDQLKKDTKNIYGPYPGLNTKEALKILRKIFNISTCKPNQGKECFYYQLHQCLGVCTGEINSKDYSQKVIKPLIMFLRGNKKRLVTDLKKQMVSASKSENYEEAARLRDQIGNLKKIQDVTLINKNFFEEQKNILTSKSEIRIEGYDISNFGEKGKVGSMVVFNYNGTIKSEYRKFKIKSVKGQSDVDCLKEIMIRRFKRKHNAWAKPNYILVDGGKPQVNAVKKTLLYDIPVIGIAKGRARKKNEFIFDRTKKLSEFVKNNEQLLIQARDEAHRFAINYQRSTRRIAS